MFPENRLDALMVVHFKPYFLSQLPKVVMSHELYAHPLLRVNLLWECSSAVLADTRIRVGFTH